MIRGWCPSLHEPMETGDGLLVRVKPPFGRVPSDAARVLADAAVALGNGAIELTGRGALQFRGFSADGAARFAAVAVRLGLAVPDPAQERRRSVLVSPAIGLDPTVAPETEELARSLERAILADEALATLPAKFGFAVDGGGTLPLGPGADIGVLVGVEGCWVVPDGAGLAVRVRPGEAVDAVLRLAHGFLAHAGTARRMRTVAAAALAASGLRAEPFEPAIPDVGVGPFAWGAFGAGVPFGGMTAETLRGLGVIADSGDGILRITPWRSVLLGGVTGRLTGGAALAALGLVTAPDDPVLLVSACPGRPGCASASVSTRAIAARLRPMQPVHVSGCSKGCAHPGPAALTFVGRDGRFDLVRNGRASDIPVARGLVPADMMRVQ